MSTIVVCDTCDTRLDSPELDLKERHVRATLTYVQLGQPDVLVERDLCEACAQDTRRAFEARPFIDSRSSEPKAKKIPMSNAVEVTYGH
jgi:hypothetical protein